MNLAAAAAATLSTLANLIFYILDTSSSPILLRLGSEGGTTILEHLDTKNLDRCGTSLLDEGRGDKIFSGPRRGGVQEIAGSVHFLTHDL